MSSMMTIAFFCLVAFTFFALRVVDKFSKTESIAIRNSNVVLVVASLLFVAYSDWKCAIIIVVYSYLVFSCSKKGKIKAGIVLSLVALGLFKYFGFFVDSFAKAFGLQPSIGIQIILPLGISFFVFSAIGYLVDVSRGKQKALGFGNVLFYLVYFPKFVSGPIISSTGFFEQISRRRRVGYKSFETGIWIFVVGLFKKAVLADRLSVFVGQVYATPKVFGSLTLALAVLTYSLELFLDFSGYSDMAVGISKILGIELPRNFNLPYISHNVTEFWKRWHMSLSKWLMNYLYIPLGGNRKGKYRMYLNLFLTMLLGGLWHGAGWNFLIWGAIHGIALVVHKVWMNKVRSKEKDHCFWTNLLSVIITFIFVSITWVFFANDSFINALDIIIGVFSFRKGLQQPYIWSLISFVFLFISTVTAIYKSSSFELKQKNTSKAEAFYVQNDLSKFWNLVLFFVFSGMTFALLYTDANPFIYGAF